MSTGITLDSARLSNLRKWNIGLTVLHGAQALLILLLAGDFAITVTSTFPQGPLARVLTRPAPSSTCRSVRPSRSSS